MPGLRPKTLDTLSAADARELLLKIAPRIETHADGIAALCGHLPLALRLAAAGNLGIAYADLGETRRAIEFFEQTLLIHREIGDRRGEGYDLWNMSLALDQLGERGQAIPHAEQALTIYEQIESPNVDKVRTQLAAWREQTNT